MCIRDSVGGEHELLDHLLCLAPLPGYDIDDAVVFIENELALRCIDIRCAPKLSVAVQDVRKLLH